MAYDLEMLLSNRFNVVYGGNDEERESLGAAFLEEYPGYKTEVSDRFLPKKVGPFTKKVNDTMIDILMSDKVLKSKGKAYVMEQAKIMGFDAYVQRLPRTLSYYQRLSPTLLMDVVNGKTQYLFCDNILKSDDYYFEVMKWLESFGEFSSKDGRVIWITYLSRATLLSVMYKMEMPCEMFELKDGALVHHKNMYADYVARENSELSKLMEEIAIGEVDCSTLEHFLGLLKKEKDLEFMDSAISIMDYHLLEDEENELYLEAMDKCKAMKDALLNNKTDLSFINTKLGEQEVEPVQAETGRNVQEEPKPSCAESASSVQEMAASETVVEKEIIVNPAEPEEADSEMAEEKKKEALRIVKKILATYNAWGYVSKDNLNVYLRTFEEAQSAEHWYKLAKLLQQQRDDDAVFAETHILALDRAAALGHAEAKEDLAEFAVAD